MTVTLESAKCSSVVGRFLSHTQLGQVALTGGAAIRIHLVKEHEPLNDLDFVAVSVDAVRPSVTADFLISHFHVPHDGYPKFMIQLVDPVARMRLDVFPDSLRAIPRASSRHVGECSLLVLAAADILRHKQETLSKSSAQRPVDAKHLRHTRVLAEFLGESCESVPASHLTKDVYVRDVTTYTCERCERSLHPDYPLAEKARIFEILGYV